jgi:hypothetical protein
LPAAIEPISVMRARAKPPSSMTDISTSTTRIVTPRGAGRRNAPRDRMWVRGCFMVF